jgi:hypothetical protein
MLCGKCYTLNTGVESHIRTLGDELGQNKKNQKDVARIEKAWGIK